MCWKKDTLILGWSAKIGPIITELILANLSLARAKIVVLADVDKVEMEEQIAATVGKRHTTEIICRSGKPTEIQNINIVSPNTARSIIILKETINSDDALIIKSLLAVKKFIDPARPVPIITEISDPQNIDAAKSVYPDIAVVRPNELITRLIAQSARQPGLSKVYGELLSFEGHEIYFHNPGLTAPTIFSDVSRRYQNAVAIGIYSKNGEDLLCPQHDVVVDPSDQVVLIAEDDDQINFEEKLDSSSAIKRVTPPEVGSRPEHIWIIGWHQLGNILLDEFNALLPSGSSITVIYDGDYTLAPPEPIGVERSYKLNTVVGDTSNKAVIDTIDTTVCTHIVVMSYRDSLDEQNADDKTLLSIIHLRKLCEKHPQISLTSELINFENKELITESDDISDFVASEELVSQVIVQLAENPKIDTLLSQLLTADGPEFHMRSFSRYPNASSFRELSELCFSYGEIAIGYQHNNSVFLNPSADTALDLGGGDAVIVLAEE